MKIEPNVHFVVKYVEPNNYDYDENISTSWQQSFLFFECITPSVFRCKKPIFFTGNEYNGSFLPDEPLKDRHLLCRPLTEKDIVLNTNLQQIFPKKTGRIPEQLVQLLNKTTEKIY